MKPKLGNKKQRWPIQAPSDFEFKNKLEWKSEKCMKEVYNLRFINLLGWKFQISMWVIKFDKSISYS